MNEISEMSEDKNCMKKISVVIPTYNRAGSIKGAIESVLVQTYPVYEVIVADDCSQDDTEEIVKSIEDDRVRYYRLPENKGAGGARNFGVSKAKGEYIAFHDSDDAWVPQKLERQMAYYEEHPECGLVYSAYEMLLPYDIRHVVPDLNRKNCLEGNIFEPLLLQNTIGAPTVVMPMRVFEEVGGFDESMRSLEDWDFALKVAQRYSIGFVPEVLLKVTSSAGGVSSNVGAYYQNRCYMLRKYRTEYLETNMFNSAVQDILEKAKSDNLLPQVEKLMMAYMSK